MSYKSKDTIFALSTPWGFSAVSVIRISGPDSGIVLSRLCKIQNLKPRVINYCNIFDEKKLLIDRAVVIYFQAPKSFTGEDMVEFQVHGGKAVIAKILSTLEKIKGLKSAEPGDFSKKAFINRKVSLIEVEGINKLILAETELQRRVATDQSFGKLSILFSEWKKKLVKISAIIDAQIEFSEEDEKIISSDIQKLIRGLIDELSNALNMSKSSKQLVDGINVLIFGPPNAGKSSLFNLINQEEKSIT